MDFADCSQKQLLQLVQMLFSPTSLAVMICTMSGASFITKAFFQRKKLMIH